MLDHCERDIQMNFYSSDRLKRAVIISLFSWRRDDHQWGWWGDLISDITLGSCLWKLKQSKLTQQTIADAKTYCEQALQWLIDEGVCRVIDVQVQRNELDSLSIEVTLTKNDGQKTEIRFSDVWK